MSELNAQVEHEDESKTPDKKQIEAEEKEIMLKSENLDVAKPEEAPADSEGPVKTALAAVASEEGREVKPKYIPIGGIKMPGFFTRNIDKEKNKEEEAADTEGEKDKTAEATKTKRRRLLFTCPFTQFLHHPENQGGDTLNNEDQPSTKKKILEGIRLPLANMFQKTESKDAEATLASTETLEDKLDTSNDGMETVKLDSEDTVEGKVATKMPLNERIKQRKFVTEDLVVCAVVVLVVLLATVGILVGLLAGPPTERPLREGRFMTTITSCGHVEGILQDGAYKFLGIPYALPPVGENRFSYAQPLNNLSFCWNGTLNVHKPAPVCLQFLENGTILGEEDCLTIDVVTPHVSYDSPLPVVVLIGANSLAGGISPVQPSPRYARTKEVVFVKPNFRLGPFGFLALDVLSNLKYPPTSGNYALSDLIVALEWIQNNIKHFGGDPQSVTLLGHRAGATLAATLTTIKKAQKLYTRAWLTSGSVIFPGTPMEETRKTDNNFKQTSNCEDAACLLRLTSTQILQATPDTWLENQQSGLPVGEESIRSWLVLDGDLLRVHPYDVWDAKRNEQLVSGKEKNKKMIVFGTTEHSAHTDLLKRKHVSWTPEIVEKLVNDSIIGQKGLSSAVFEHFDKTYEGFVGLISAIRTVCPLMSLTGLRLDAPLYVVQGSGAGGGVAGSGIATVNADVEAILGTFASDMPEQRRFVAAMQQMFYYFVWHGRLPAPDGKLLAVGQDTLPLSGLPACDLFIREDIVPRFARVD